MSEIKIFKGDSRTVRAVITDSGAPFDLTGYSAKLTVKKSPSDTEKKFDVTGTIDADPTKGIITFEITPANSAITPGKYFFDIEIKKGTDKVYTVDFGAFIVEQDITN